MCGITGRSYTYRLSGSFNQRTVVVELAANLNDVDVFFYCFVDVAVIVVIVGVAVTFVIVDVIVYSYQQY